MKNSTFIQTRNVRCSKEMRQTLHTVTIEEIEDGISQIKWECQTCEKPDIRTEIMIADMTGEKKEIWDEFKRIGMPDLRDPELVVVEDQGEKHRQHHEETKRKFMENSKKLLQHWKAVLIISIVALLVLKFIFQVI